MKTLKVLVHLAAAALAALAFAPPAFAFHDGGVAYCDGCHSMHNSSGNKAMSGGRNTGLTGWNAAGKASTVKFQGNAYLLQGSDDSSTCLNCHAAADAAPNSYHVMTFPVPASTGSPVERTPGGDFAWLKITTTAKASYGSPVSNPGDRHGHNVVAQDYGLTVDATLATAPGGTFPAANLSCASCHDPHSRARVTDAAGTIVSSKIGQTVKPIAGPGSYGDLPDTHEARGVYRLLGSATYVQDSVSGMTPFTANPPVAVAPATYNVGEGTTEVHVAYGQGMSEWCANCHTAIHNDNTGSANAALIHPAGNGAKLTATANDLNGNVDGTTIAKIYNAYRLSGDLGGSQATSYTSLVPYEEGTADLATLAAKVNPVDPVSGLITGPGATGGPTTGNENVMCLSCHRAHASGWSSGTRWNNKAEFLTLGGAWPGTNATGEGAYGQYSMGYTQAQYQAAMYDRPAGNYAYAQRSLCNKCHAKD